MRIWIVEAAEIERLQGRDRDFAGLMNDLLVSHASDNGIPQSALRLNLNTYAPDGGVDAAVDVAIPTAVAGDYCDVPTCWQYKASASGNLKPPRSKKGGQKAALAHEINKSECRRLIGLGYGYRLCITDEITPDKLAEWEGWLRVEAEKIRSDAAPPRVLTATRIATWINRYTGLIRRLRPELAPFRNLVGWGTEIRHLTEHYHPIGGWDNSIRTIREFADFSRPVHRAVLSVRGEAGVGKTRCVYEALASNPVNRAVVVYTTDEAGAEALANHLAGNPEANALIVADECGQAVAVKLDRSLRAHAGRLRVIAIDNQQQSERTNIGELRLLRLSREDVVKILEANSRGILPDRLRAFAHLSEGFVRLAVDLCDHQHLIPPDGTIHGSLTEFFRRHYLEERLRNPDELTAVLVVSLVTRVGFSGEVAEQLGHLCRACRGLAIDAGRIVEVARRLKQSPGFIALGERFLYVTPRLIAQAAFRAAWDRWVGRDPNVFFMELHPDLVESFLRQLRDAGTEAMRRDCADFFMTWISCLAEEDLADEARVRRLVRLADVEPDAVLPRIRQVVESIPRDALAAIHAGVGLDTFDLELIRRSAGGQAARRELVWFAERFLTLPEHYPDAERILFRLALAETESYGNNATGIWQQIFQVALSGTPVPYPDRIALLDRRFGEATETSIGLLIGALSTCVSSFQLGMSRILGSPTVAGRIPPPDWRPGSSEEWQACWATTVELIRRLSRHASPLVRERVLALTIDRLLHPLILMGSLREAIEIIDRHVPLGDVLLAKLLQEIDEFLEIFCEPGSRRVPEAVEADLRTWRARLVPDTFHGKLVAVIGEEPWKRWGGSEDEEDSEIEEIARKLLTDRDEFERELPWLLSEEAKSSYRLGVRVGSIDDGGRLLEPLLMTVAQSANPALARGYIKALAETHPTHLDRINSALDRCQQEAPRVAFDLISTGCAPLRPLPRLLAMVDAGQLPPVYIRGYAYMGRRSLPPEELSEVLGRLIASARDGDGDAARAALDVSWNQYRAARRDGSGCIDAGSPTRRLLAEVLELTLENPGREAHAWDALLGELAKTDPAQAIRLAAAALSSRGPNLAEYAAARLTQLSASYPLEVMKSFGDALLDPETGAYLGLRSLRGIVAALPVDVVRAWLEEGRGVEAAAAIARHLPEPTLVDGEPTVPELTSYVLDRFGQDERVYREFCAGTFSRSHSGDIAAQIEQEGEEARPFLANDLPSIRKWAKDVIERSKKEAAYWRARDEEAALPR